MADMSLRREVEREGVEAGDDAPTPISVHAQARAFIEQCHGDRVKASVLLAEWLRENVDIHGEWMAFRCANYVCRHIVANDRAKVRGVVTKPDQALVRGMVLAVKAAEQRWLDEYRLSNGMALGDCTKEHLASEIEKYHKSAAESAKCARWLQLIADRIGNKRVRDKLSEEQIAKLRAQSEVV